MDLETAVRTRRTHKAYGPEPVERETLDALFELARWAPNHRVTNPWRFTVLGEQSRAALEAASEERQPGSAVKLRRAPTLVALSFVRAPDDPGQDAEDRLSAAIAGYLVLLGAHARGLAGYWRTVPVLDSAAGRAALGLPDGEEPLGLLYLGTPREEQRAPERAAVETFARYLD
jgi:nitroreductase